MNREDLVKWFDETFWPLYIVLVKTPFPTKYKQGTKGEALKRMLTLNPSADLRLRIYNAFGAQTKHRLKLYEKLGSASAYNKHTEYQKFYANRNGSTWIFNLGYEDEIPSIIEERQVLELTELCVTENCKNPRHGSKLNLCQSCLCKQADVYREEKRDYLKSHDMTMNQGESLHDYAMRCKKLTFKIMPNIKF